MSAPLGGALGLMQSDFAAICAAEFSEQAVVTDGTVTVTLPCLFDANYQPFDPDTDSKVIYAGSRMTIAETAVPDGFSMRRIGLVVTVRGAQYTTRSDWEFDGLGQFLVYLDPINPNGQPLTG